MYFSSNLHETEIGSKMMPLTTVGMFHGESSSWNPPIDSILLSLLISTRPLNATRLTTGGA